MAEPLYYSPQRETPVIPSRPGLEATDAILRRERETIQTLQAALDRAYEIIGPLRLQDDNIENTLNLKIEKLKIENEALEKSLGEHQRSNDSLKSDLIKSQTENNEYKAILQSLLDQLRDIMEEDKWKIPEGTRLSHLHNLEPPTRANEYQECIGAHLKQLMNIRRIIGEQERTDLTQRASMDMKAVQAELKAAQNRVASQGRLIEELTKTVEAQKSRIESQKQTIETLNESLGTQRSPEVANAAEQTAMGERQVFSPEFGRSLFFTSDLELHPGIDDEASPGLSQETFSDKISQSQMLMSGQSESQPDSASPTPHLDALFTATRKPRVRLRNGYLSKESAASKESAESTVITAGKKKKRAAVPLLTPPPCGRKEDNDGSSTTGRSTNIRTKITRS